MEFRLYADAAGTAQVSSLVSLPVPVADGYFAAELDFGGDAFNGDARWLDIKVQCTGDPSMADLGLQALTAAPYAQYTLDAKALGGSGIEDLWQLSGNTGTMPETHFLGTSDGQDLVFKTNGAESLRLTAGGSLGLGTDSPGERLTVSGNALLLGEDAPAARGHTSDNLSKPYSLYVSGHYAYVASDGNDRLAIFDISDPDEPAARGYTSTNLDNPQSVYVSVRYAYVASYLNHRLAIFDVSDPNSIEARGFTGAGLLCPKSVHVSGHYAYVASEVNDGLAIFDVSDPDNIVARGYTDTNLDAPHSVYVSGRYAYVSSRYNHRLAIFDVSDPDNIVARGFSGENLNEPISVYVSGRYAYVASFGNNQLVIFDVGDPDNIVARGFTNNYLVYPYSVHVSGRYAYVASMTLAAWSSLTSAIRTILWREATPTPIWISHSRSTSRAATCTWPLSGTTAWLSSISTTWRHLRLSAATYKLATCMLATTPRSATTCTLGVG